MIVAVLALLLALAGTAIAIDRGSVGARELAKVEQRSKTDLINPPGDERGQATVRCKRKEQLLGGGATLPDADPQSTDPPSVEQSGPSGRRGWKAVAHSDNDVVTLRATALCLSR
jgi:hypothetical protein